ncbi:glycosyltransferase family 4 protein [Rhodobium gokarnense]|uniref:Glycosyltransferase involved in cell wall biosynthesis n=1 Tax=Rhodobium gokarnense TaxID=364296 RepID=A0ABT3HHT6_9HYPH|nr:glycosyltransferase family 4 protein [Rhodobium gokarnense]MCW2309953.1 glycosyltransferase involved in cell wall biosynthesis [Rhodobium gokarnense]
MTLSSRTTPDDTPHDLPAPTAEARRRAFGRLALRERAAGTTRTGASLRAEVGANAHAGADAAPTVSFLTLVLSHYRIPFHTIVRDILAEHGVNYRLIYSDPVGSDAKKGDTLELPWAVKIPVTRIPVPGVDLYWQNALDATRGSALTVISQENKLLVNYLLQARYLLGGSRLAFFGHGKNYQASRPDGWREKLKAQLATRVHWWFAYTPGVKKIVEDYGFPGERITVNYNSIDTGALKGELAAVTDADIAAEKAKLGITSDNIAIYIGGMYQEKRLPFLIDAAEKIRARVPDFHLVMVGSGSHSEIAQIAAASCDYIHFLGPRFGREKATLLKMAKAFVMPGLVGLAIIDSFAAGCPMVTTDVPYHSPEIEYLKDGENGLITSDPENVTDYANAVAALLTDDTLQARLSDGAKASVEDYTIERMARNFAEGVLAAIA